MGYLSDSDSDAGDGILVTQLGHKKKGPLRIPSTETTPEIRVEQNGNHPITVTEKSLKWNH